MSNRAPRFLPVGPHSKTAIAFAMMLGAFMSAQRLRAADETPRIWLGGPRPLASRYHGKVAVRSTQSSPAAPLSLATEDFDQDGIGDLAVGYSTPEGGRISIYRGNLDAFAPQSQASHLAIGRSEFPSPYLPDAQVIEVPVNPDFLAAGRFQGDGSAGLALAARGDHRLYLLNGDGTGQLSVPQSFDLPGAVTAMAAFTDGLYSRVLVGVHAGKASILLEFTGSADGLIALRSVSLNADATSFASGNLDGDHLTDVAVVAGGNLFVLRGSSSEVEEVPTGLRVQSVALGSFVFDRSSRLQMAALADDGSAHILVRGDFDPTPYTPEEMQARRARQRQARDASAMVETEVIPLSTEPLVWKEVETISGVADGQGAPLLMKTRISNNAADDVLTLSHGRLGVLAHPGLALTDNNPFPPGSLLKRTDSIQHPVAALATRVNVDGRPGMVYLSRDSIEPQVMMPLPDPTFFPNRFDDIAPRGTANTCKNTSAVDGSNDCTLREAIIKANGDTIMLQAGTYQLSLPKVANDYTGNHGALYMNNSATIVGMVDGSGNPTSIIQAGTNATNGVDLVMAVNADSIAFTSATGSLSNVVIKFGHDNGTFSGNQDGFGGGMEFDTGLAPATASLTLTNCLVTNNTTTDGDGGGLALFNTNNGTGFTTITNSTIQNNSPNRTGAGNAAIGGGIFVAATAKLVMNNSHVINNMAIQAGGQGGGLYIFGSGTSPTTSIHGGSISGNQSSALGGGLLSTTTMVIDSGTIISNNISGSDGGGFWYNNISKTTSVSKLTITGNSAANKGGGIYVGAGSNDIFNISFSRLAGNTATNGGSNLSNQGSTVTAQNNWWGTNAAASTINGTVTFDPFIVLTHNGNAQKIRINQSSTLTGDMSKDNHGTAVGLANLNQIIGLPITFDAPVLGTIPQAQPETLNANAQATATFNAGGTSGLGSAHATVDQAVVPVNSNLIASATESGSTATITTVGVHGYSTGEFVSISGVGVGGYNGNFFKILSTPTATTFTYTAGSSGLGNSSGGTANAGIIILKPPSMTKSFSPKTIQTTAGTGIKVSTLTFSITNGNVVPIDASFTDNLPANVGVVPGNLVVASTPNAVNNCGGTLTAVAGAGSISLSNQPAVAVGTCTIKVDVQSATDNAYSNSVTIDSTDAGNGNTSSDTLTVIDPPHIVKTFGQASIPFGATTSLTLTVSSTNQNLTLSGIAFTDSLPTAAPGTVIVANPNNLSNTCSTTPSAVAGSSTVSLSGASLAPGASCIISLNVQGTAVGAANNSVSVSDTIAGTGNTSSALLTIVKADTTTGVTSSVNPSVFGQSVTFTATVSAVAPGAGTPTGTVTFLDGGNPIGTGTLSGGVATFTTSALAVGNHTITTSYPGDTNFNGSTGSLSGNPQVVNKADTATAVVSSQNPSVFGQSVTFTATVSPVAPGTGTPGGTVTFLDGGNPIGTGTLSGGVATFTTSALAVGSHTITTSYGGNASFNGSTGSLTGNPQVVNKADTTTLVTSSANPSVQGQSVTFTATITPVAPGAGTPTGTVTFLDGGSPIGTGTLSGGVATFTTSALAIGNHTITTNYGGDGNFNGSNGSLTGNPQVVNKANTTTAVTSSQNPSVLGQSVTFTATVSPVAPGTGTPTGTVTFLDGGSPIGTGTLSGGVATFTTSALTAGSHTITTSYGGDANFNGSTGSLTGNPQVVNKANTTTAVVSSQNPSTFGQSVTFTATVSPVAPGTGTPTGTVTFLDGGSPIGTGTLSGGVATFTTSALAAGNHTITTNYGGDPSFNGSTGSLTGNPQVVNKSNTTTAVTSSQNPSNFGQSVTFTASVSPVPPGAGSPTGTVTFLDGGSPIGTGTLSGGQATFSTSALAAGNHTITTSYPGDGNFNGSTGSLTGNPQVVNAVDLTVSKTHNPSSFTVNDVNDTFTITVKNQGTLTSSGTITVTDTLPAGLTFNGSSTPGWMCSAVNQVVTCTTTNTINGNGGMSAVVINVNVASSTGSPLTNNVSVACTCTESNTNNNTGSDMVTVLQVVNITLTASPAGQGLTVSLDGGTAFTAPHTYQLVPGSMHTIATTSPQPPGAVGTEYVFNHWSDMGAISHQITVPMASASIDSFFDIFYQISLDGNPNGAGTVSPASGTFYPKNFVLNISATPNNGNQFVNWTGDPVANANSASTTITMDAPHTVHANFSAQPTNLGAQQTGKSGPLNARLWSFNIVNTGPGVANAAQITSFTLTGTGGTVCTPVIGTASVNGGAPQSFPNVQVGNMAPNSSIPVVITIDFSQCGGIFNALINLSANAGATTASVPRFNQRP